MSESITISGITREEQYISLLPQLAALVDGETDMYAALGNIMSALKYGMNFYWAGLYVVKGNELVLGPFQGTVACTRIAFGKGVCGYVWKYKKAIIVNDVNTFEGHIACSAETKSEIVLPVFDKKGNVKMALDIDSEYVSHFSQTDEKYLQKVAGIIEKIINA